MGDARYGDQTTTAVTFTNTVSVERTGVRMKERYNGLNKKTKVVIWVGAVVAVIFVIGLVVPAAPLTEANISATATAVTRTDEEAVAATARADEESVTATASAMPPEFDDIRDTAVTVAYDDLFRNNEVHVGKIVYYRGEVVQALDAGGDQFQLRVNLTEDSFFWTDPVFVQYSGPRILDDDIVEFVAEVVGLITYKAALGNEITIPHLTALDLRLESQSSTGTVTASSTVTVTPSAGYSRALPVSLGVPVQVSEEDLTVDVTLVDVIRGELAWSMIQAVNQFNSPPPEGFEYLLASIKVDVSAIPGIDTSIKFNEFVFDAVSNAGNVYGRVSVLGPEPQFRGELFNDGSLTGWATFAVTESDSQPLMRYAFSNDVTIWFKLSE